MTNNNEERSNSYIPINKLIYTKSDLNNPFQQIFVSPGFSMTLATLTQGMVAGESEAHSFSLSLGYQGIFNWRVSDTPKWSSPVNKGTLFFLPRGHHFYADWKGELSNLGLFISPHLFNQALPLDVDPSRIELHTQAGVSDELIWNIGRELLQRLATDGVIDKMHGEIAALYIASYTLRKYSSFIINPRLEKDRLTDADLKIVYEYINENLVNDIGLEDISTTVGRSASYFHRLFKEKTHQTPYQYLIKARVERAMRLLLSTNMTLQVIAEATGFRDASHFVKRFKAVTGITPKRYREQNKKIP